MIMVMSVEQRECYLRSIKEIDKSKKTDQLMNKIARKMMTHLLVVMPLIGKILEFM
jgi:hypothetical protein